MKRKKKDLNPNISKLTDLPLINNKNMEFWNLLNLPNPEDDQNKKKKNNNAPLKINEIYVKKKKKEEVQEEEDGEDGDYWDIWKALEDDDYNFPCVKQKGLEACSSYSYYDDLDFQKALFYSAQLGSTFNHTFQDSPPDLKMKGISRGPIPLRTYGLYYSNFERGEPSSSYCGLCEDSKPVRSLIQTDCWHSFCEDCIKLYLCEKIKEDILSVKCPEKNCKALLEYKLWHHYVPEELHDRWKKERIEGKALASPRIIECPECFGEFLDDGKGFLIRACPKCWKILCVHCRIPWHMEMSCEEFKLQQLHRNLLQKLIFQGRRLVILLPS